MSDGSYVMRQSAVALIFIFALLIIFAVYLSYSLAILQRVAIVDAVEGEAQLLVHGEGDPKPVEEGRLVRAGDVLITGPDSSVELRWVRWAGGMRITVGENSRFKVIRSIVKRSTNEEKSRLRLDVGRIWVRLRQALTGRSKFEVETPTIVAAVRGTIFSVEVAEDGSSRVEVYEGTVEVSGEDGALATLTSGSQVWLQPGQEETEIRPLTLEELGDWETRDSMLGPFLAIASPSDGFATSDPSVSVTGRTEPGVQVFVNGQEATVAEDGEFSHSVPLTEEATPLVVLARDAEGRETAASLKVVRTSLEGYRE